MTEKTNRGFLLWKPIVTKRHEEIQFQESSVVGLNTWLLVKESKNLNEIDKDKIEFNNIMVHLTIQELIDLGHKIHEVIKYQLDTENGRASWYK